MDRTETRLFLPPQQKRRFKASIHVKTADTQRLGNINQKKRRLRKSLETSEKTKGKTLSTKKE